MCTINQKTLSAISSDENNVNKLMTFCDVRKLFKDRSKSTKCKVMFLTSNKIEYEGQSEITEPYLITF